VPLAVGQVTQLGDFGWDTDFPDTTPDEKAADTRCLYIRIPGEDNMVAIPVRRGSTNEERVWGWDGNEDQPTLDPSILHHGAWHGYLRRGRLESC
jgi:Family of unknown function (DUF6527)